MDLLCLQDSRVFGWFFYPRRTPLLLGQIFDLSVFVMSAIRCWLNYWSCDCLHFFLVLYPLPRVALFRVGCSMIMFCWSRSSLMILIIVLEVVMWFLNWIWQRLMIECPGPLFFRCSGALGSLIVGYLWSNGQLTGHGFQCWLMESVMVSFSHRMVFGKVIICHLAYLSLSLNFCLEAWNNYILSTFRWDTLRPLYVCFLFKLCWWCYYLCEWMPI